MNNPAPRKKPLPIGESFFDSMIEAGYYYVDKTLFIRDILDKKTKVTLCTRPRRFGKTLNQTMLKCFFEDTAPIGGKDTGALFRGLKIEEAGELYMAHQGKYPVIFLTFKDAKCKNIDETCAVFKDMLSEEFRRHKYVRQTVGDAEDLKKFERISSGDGDISSYRDALKFLSKCLEEYHGQKTVILIDEYDVPLENSWSRGFYQEMIDFICPLLSGALKDNPHLQFSVITGCLRVSKESIFTGLNNLKTDSVLSNAYSEYFGFTQGEVDAMLDYYGLDGKKRIVRDWYNGYLFGNTEVYNPWSCLFAVDSWMTNTNERPKPYWVNTSGNDIIHDMIDRMNAEARTGLETLVSDGTVSAAVDEYVTYGDMYKTPDNLWNFLLFTGYLKKVGESVDHKGKIIVDVKIPNKEVDIVFETKIWEWFNDRVKEKDLGVFLKAVINGDAETFQDELSMLLAESISFMDNAENFYHGFLVGVLTKLDGYRLKSNRESGDGRSDLVLYSANGRDDKAVIFEFKVAPKAKMLPDACADALKQIEEKNYAAYWDDEGYKDIIKYGIGFHRKRCEVRRGE
jgi:hypothetical protein